MLSIFSEKIKLFNNLDSRGVYKIACTDCNLAYIGETDRPLKIRLKEHKHNCLVQNASSAVTNHFGQGHAFNFENSRVIHRELNTHKQKIAEALMIYNTRHFLETNRHVVYRCLCDSLFGKQHSRLLM